MNTFSRWLLLAFALFCALPAHAQSTPDNRLVVPGERIGRVFLGDSSKTVRRRLGAPAKTFKLPGGLRSELWRAYDKANETNHVLEVIYKRGAVVQIEVSNPVFKTATGRSSRDYSSAWTKDYGTARATTYRYKGGKQDQTYFDWVRRGVAIETQENTGDETTSAVIVHRRGVRAVPDISGKRLD